MMNRFQFVLQPNCREAIYLDSETNHKCIFVNFTSFLNIFPFYIVCEISQLNSYFYSDAFAKRIDETEMAKEDCRVPCRGIFADVKKYDLEEYFGESYDVLLDEYERFRYFNESGVKFYNYIGCKCVFLHKC